MRNLTLGKTLFVALTAVWLSACSTTETQETDPGPSTTETQVEVETQTDTISAEERAREEERRQMERLQSENTVYFEFDSDRIQSQFRDVLSMHGQYLANNASKSVTIEGHTDERGTPEYNLALGERRAKAVERVLRSYGASEGQIRVVSYGEEQPANPAHNEQAWSQNRRAVVNYSN